MQILYTIYLILLCGVLPIYMKDGYYELGEAKSLCYLLISAPFAALILFNILFTKRGQSDIAVDEELHAKRKVLASEFFLYGNAFSVLITFIFSSFKRTAFLGIEGWRNGVLTLSIAIAFCIISSLNKYKTGEKILVILMIVPFLEMILSILNRFSIYPIDINGQNTSFLSTVGNINWFSGYLAIWVPLGISIMFLSKAFSKRFMFSGLYTVVGLIALFLQGSDGATLILIACYVFMLFWSLSDRNLFRKFLIQVVVLGISMTIVDVLIAFWGNYYNYEQTILLTICKSHIGIILVAAAFFLYRLGRLFEEINMPFRGNVYKWVCGVCLSVLAICCAAWLISSFDDSFGNGRGIIYRMCLDMYMGLSPWQKLVGIGQDCIYPYAMADSMWSSSFRNVFGDLVLTNAHCEFMTTLIERGLLGAFLYIGLFISVIYQLIKIKEKEPQALAFGLPIISYLVYEQISFSQVMSMPYAYILVGMGIGLCKVGNRD